MSSLFASLTSAGSSLTALDLALEATQNNVSNASTPGYARQSVTLEALPFQPLAGLPGGVEAGALESARNEYADQQVRQSLQSVGYFDQKVNSLTALQGSFDISGNSGIDKALNRLFQSFSAWSVTPDDPTLRQNVLDSAGTLAQSFQTAAADLDRFTADTDLQARQTVDQINTLTSRLRDYNAQRVQSGQPDAGLDARIHATLEELAQLVNFDAVQQADGSVTVLLGGQTPLVMGDRQYALSLDLQTSAGGATAAEDTLPPARIRSADGTDITAQVSGGKLGALLDTRNQFLPTLMGDANQPGDLNRLAKAVADRVNQLLTAGLSSDGPPPVAGVPLFVYDTNNDTNAARSLAVSANIQAGQLAAIDPGPPYGSNGTALKLAGLASPTSTADKIDGLSYVEFYGNMAGHVGNQLASASDSLDTQKQVAAQASSQRDRISGVSLDEEAIHLIEFQRAYQATAKMITVLDSLTDTTVNMLQ